MSHMQFSKRDAANEGGFVSDPARVTTDRLNILVVDDSPSILALLRSYLLAQGHAVASADDGEQALAMFDRIAPDLVLMDVVMPGLDGIEVTRRLRESSGSRWVPIILLSALSTEQDVVRGLEAGADDYLSKPINLAVMQAKIRSFQRIVRMQGEILEQSGALQKLQEEQTYEQELAAALINNIVQRQGSTTRFCPGTCCPPRASAATSWPPSAARPACCTRSSATRPATASRHPSA